MAALTRFGGLYLGTRFSRWFFLRLGLGLAFGSARFGRHIYHQRLAGFERTAGAELVPLGQLRRTHFVARSHRIQVVLRLGFCGGRGR